MNVKITFRSGEMFEVKHEARPGGSYSVKVRYEIGFVIVTDVWGKETAFPTELVQSVESTPTRGGW